MEINIQIKNVQKPEDIVSAFAALGQTTDLHYAREDEKMGNSRHCSSPTFKVHKISFPLQMRRQSVGQPSQALRHYGGSFETARAATQEDQVLKDSNAKAFCVSRNRYSFDYIAFEQLAQPPSTARILINQ
ncbi:hypothetical protein AK812_SmicGene6840 [Symbiodinium microadriaticum]|uniref:Uncharacterized protein n=1 Tax=Symbiodinium microadriaticum TaxID=2951 RepID=A0A1Q9EQ59_SYMMI|nr:hypothetical protein AK812_SmicGene6840 [Symbiodinium microadriaticum]